MLKLLKKYCVEICLLLVVVMVLLRTSNILERFRERELNATEKNALAERLRLMETAGVLNINI